MSLPIVSTIILSYNTTDLTVESVQRVLDEYDKSQINGEVIVVDNHSTDDSVITLEKTFKSSITMIKNKQNLGFSKGNNVGIKHSKGKYLLFLNSDAFVHTGAIKQFLEVFEKFPDLSTAQQANTKLIDRVGIVSGMLLNKDGSLQKQGGALPTWWTIFLWWIIPVPSSFSLVPTAWSYHIENKSFFLQQQKVGWLAGTALMVRKEVLDEVGVFDESIFMYAEDVELCIRAANHHWDVVYTPKAKITHLGSASSLATNALIGEVLGLKHVAEKHFSPLGHLLVLNILKLGTILRYLVFGIIPGHESTQKIYKAVFQNLQKK